MDYGGGKTILDDLLRELRPRYLSAAAQPSAHALSAGRAGAVRSVRAAPGRRFANPIDFQAQLDAWSDCVNARRHPRRARSSARGRRRSANGCGRCQRRCPTATGASAPRAGAAVSARRLRRLLAGPAQRAAASQGAACWRHDDTATPVSARAAVPPAAMSRRTAQTRDRPFLGPSCTLAPRDLPFCEQERRVRFVPWHRTGTGWTPFEGATGRAFSRTSTLPWRAATRHAKMAAQAYVRVQRETRLKSSSYTVDLRHAHEQDRKAPPDHRRGALPSGDNSA